MFPSKIQQYYISCYFYFRPKIRNREVFINEEDSQNPFGFLNNSSKQIECISSKGIEEQPNSNPMSKENLVSENENEEIISEQKEQLDPIQSAKKSTNVDSNLKNEQILEDQDIQQAEENGKFEKDLNVDMELEKEEPNRTLENENLNQIDIKETLNYEEKEPEQIEDNLQISGKYSKFWHNILFLCVSYHILQFIRDRGWRRKKH